MQPLTYQKLTPDQIESELKTTNNWQINNGALTKCFPNKTYANGALNAMAITHLAEKLNHHPDIFLSYKELKISMVTHDAEGGLTAFDFELARRIDQISS